MKFSQRNGILPSTKKIQLNSIDNDLKNSLWNIIKINVLDIFSKYEYNNEKTDYKYFAEILWQKFHKKPIDNLTSNDHYTERLIREYYFSCEWYEIYDFIEFLVHNVIPENMVDIFIAKVNTVFEIEFAGYRFVNYVIAPISNNNEIEEIEEAINQSISFSSLEGVNIHLTNALHKLSDRNNPDYRNSIKESISAIESLCVKISNNPNDSLGGALDKIKGLIKLHPALEKGFKQIYGYTSDADGIRHAIIETSTCDFEDAKYMLVSCSAFVNYLIIKANKAKINFK